MIVRHGGLRKTGLSKVCALCLVLLAYFCLPAAAVEYSEKPSVVKSAFEIGAHFYDYQNYHGVPYFHGGLDICADAGTEVFTPVAGQAEIFDYKITASAEPHVFSYSRQKFRRGDVSRTRYLEVAITTSEGHKWMFRHIDPATVPDHIFRAAERKAAVPAGSTVGRIARWLQPVLPEKRLYNHVHLEILDAGGNYLNPARFVKTSKDYYPPQLHGLYAVKHGTPSAIEIDGRNHAILSGRIDLVGCVTDRMNRAAYRHSIYAASLFIDRIDVAGSTTARIEEYEVFRFDRLPFKGERTQLSKVIFRDQIMVGPKKLQANASSGPRSFLINFSSGTTKTGYAADKSFDTARYPDGSYLLGISIEDYAGNTRQYRFPISIRNR